MRQKIFATFLGSFSIYAAIIFYFFPLDANSVKEPREISIRVIFLLLPLLFLFMILYSASLRKWVRVIVFNLTRVRRLATTALIILLATTSYMVIVTGSNRILSDPITTNVIALDFVLALAFFLVIAGGVKVSESTALTLEELDGDGKIYLYQNRVIRHIPDPETFKLFGFYWNEVSKVPHDEFDTYTKRSDIESVITATFVRDSNNTVWYTAHDEKKRVPDRVTLRFITDINKKGIEDDAGQLAKLRDIGSLTSVVNF